MIRITWSIRTSRLRPGRRALGRQYRTQQFSVDQTTGEISTSNVAANTFYGQRGYVIKTTSPATVFAVGFAALLQIRLNAARR